MSRRISIPPYQVPEHRGEGLLLRRIASFIFVRQLAAHTPEMIHQPAAGQLDGGQDNDGVFIGDEVTANDAYCAQ